MMWKISISLMTWFMWVLKEPLIYCAHIHRKAHSFQDEGYT